MESVVVSALNPCNFSATHRRHDFPTLKNHTFAAPPLPRLFSFALLFGAVQAIYASVAARDLNADGSYYLLQALSHGGLSLIEPARKTVQFLQQSLSYAGYLLGVRDVSTYGMLLTLGVQGWPLALTAAAWFVLPRSEKGWILGPLLNLAVFIPVTNFFGIGEGIIASSLMWLLYFVVEFRMQKWPTALCGCVLGAGCIYLHEAAFPFMAGIALLAAARARAAGGSRRAYLYVLAIVAGIAALHLSYLVAFPRDPINRGAFLHGLTTEFLIDVSPDGTGVNLLAIAAIVAVMCLLGVHFPRRRSQDERQRQGAVICALGLTLYAVITVLFVVRPEQTMIPHAYFAARGLPIVATTAMTAVTHLSLRAGSTPQRFTPAPVKFLILGAILMQFVVQTIMTSHWNSYRRDLAGLVASHSGIIDWQSASSVLDPDHTPFRRHLVRAWSIQPLSILLAPEGHVRSLVDVRRDISWRAYDPGDPANLPLCARGLDWSRYLAARHETDVWRRISCG